MMVLVDATKFVRSFVLTSFRRSESFGGLDVARNFGFVCFLHFVDIFQELFMRVLLLGRID
jgi:hypothetical protein